MKIFGVSGIHYYINNTHINFSPGIVWHIISLINKSLPAERPLCEGYKEREIGHCFKPMFCRKTSISIPANNGVAATRTGDLAIEYGEARVIHLFGEYSDPECRHISGWDFSKCALAPLTIMNCICSYIPDARIADPYHN